MKAIFKRLFSRTERSDRGQAALEFILPLVLLLFVLVAFAMVIPVLTPTRTLALAGGVIIFVLSFVSTQLALYILIFSMLLSPEFIVGSTEGATLGRGITLRVDDLIVAIIGFSWLARMAINKDLGLFLRTPLNRPIAYYILVCRVYAFGFSFRKAGPEDGAALCPQVLRICAHLFHGGQLFQRQKTDENLCVGHAPHLPDRLGHLNDPDPAGRENLGPL